MYTSPTTSWWGKKKLRKCSYKVVQVTIDVRFMPQINMLPSYMHIREGRRFINKNLQALSCITLKHNEHIVAKIYIVSFACLKVCCKLCEAYVRSDRISLCYSRSFVFRALVWVLGKTKMNTRNFKSSHIFHVNLDSHKCEFAFSTFYWSQIETFSFRFNKPRDKCIFGNNVLWATHTHNDFEVSCHY